jgi:hypothetical protein
MRTNCWDLTTASKFQFRVNELGLMELVEESDGTDEEMDMDVDDMFKKCENIPVLNKSKPESDGKCSIWCLLPSCNQFCRRRCAKKENTQGEDHLIRYLLLRALRMLWLGKRIPE